MNSANLQCCTCLVLLTSEDQYTIVDNQLSEWLNETIHHPRAIPLRRTLNCKQYICNNCYDLLNVAYDYRLKVQQVEQLLMEHINKVNELVKDKYNLCCVCMQKYPKSITLLTWQVRDAPHLQKWLECCNRAKLSEQWQRHKVCRFCCGKLRDIYEWRQAVEECAEYVQLNDEHFEYPAINDIDVNVECILSTNPIHNHNWTHENVSATTKTENDEFDFKLPKLNKFKMPMVNGTTKKVVFKTKICQSNQRANVCPQCQRGFKKPLMLEAHILNTHHGSNKPFKCKQCQKPFITLTHLKRHLNNVHKSEWQKSYEDVEIYDFLNIS